MTNAPTEKKQPIRYGREAWKEEERKDAELVLPGDFDFDEFLAGCSFVFAKTLAHIPHEYTVRGKTAHERDDWFCAAVVMIRREGYRGTFGKRRSFMYLDHDGWHYWTMGKTLHTPGGRPYTIILNRAKGENRHRFSQQMSLEA